jgi:hypothetical protein
LCLDRWPELGAQREHEAEAMVDQHETRDQEGGACARDYSSRLSGDLRMEGVRRWASYSLVDQTSLEL